MKIKNLLPHLLDVLTQWEKRPASDIFEGIYLNPIRPEVHDMLEDFRLRTGRSVIQIVQDIDWKKYRANALKLDPMFEEERIRKQISNVESLLGETLKGDTVLLGAFTAMDGYARFHMGTHRVFLGVDENHNNHDYLDILVSHELTHVAREALPQIWEAWRLNPKMTHDELATSMPVLEHLFGEGLSCLVSELLHPGMKPHLYAYQSPKSFAAILKAAARVDKRLHTAIADPKTHYASLYDVQSYGLGEPVSLYAHYVWAWLWTKHLLENVVGGDLKALLSRPSTDFVQDALSFRLEHALKFLK